mgnify:CR=1 FL=1
MDDGDRVAVERRDGERFEGVVMPSSDDETVVVKLDDGYNVGVARDTAAVEVLESGAATTAGDEAGAGAAAEATGEETLVFDEDLPTVALLSTGGTIASTVDYRTGAVTARFDAEDVLRAVPDLAGMANYRGRVVANLLSENMTPARWQELARAVHDEIAGPTVGGEELPGADGVVVMHGTDTMQHSAAALSFMLDTPVPVVFVGSQRSADRPSSDNVVNAVCAVEAATSDASEVLVCMHADESDDACALHRGTRVRKQHTSRRDAFATVGNDPLGRVDYESREVTWRRERARRVDDPDERRDALALRDALNTDVAHHKFVPGEGPEVLDRYADLDGLVLEGTGLGHVHSDWAPRIAELVDDGTVVAMTSQCLEGRVCDRVYDTGRDLLDAGVVEAEDTLPETAYVKLMWTLANADDPAAAMNEDLAGEITASSRPWT